MRTWICCALLTLGARAEYTLNLDQLTEGSSANDAVAASYGLLLRGLGDGGPFDVIADKACLGDLSAPNVFSLQSAANCPEINDLIGFYEVEFEVGQSFVSIRTLHTLPGTVTYLMAYSGPSDGDFLDQTFGDAATVGASQLLRVERSAQETQIRRVRFGVFNLDNRRAAFDDLGFEKIPVSVRHFSWSFLRSRW